MPDTADQTLSDDQLRRQAHRLAVNRQWGLAQSVLEILVQRAPTDAYTRLDLASVMIEQGHLREYAIELLRIVQLLPDDPELVAHLVRRLYFAGEIVAARTCLDRLERLPGDGAELARRAQLRWMLGEISQAASLVTRAMQNGADTPNDHYLHAMLSQFTGQMEDASRILEVCLQRWPRFGDAAVALSNLRKQTYEKNHINQLRDLSGRISFTSNDSSLMLAKAGLESALFKELDDLGLYGEAWQALARSNTLMNSVCSYDAAGEEAMTAAHIRTSDALLETPLKARPTFNGPIPIFIVGMPRSGTTLLDRMLSSHSNVASAGEINDFRRQLRWMTDVPPGGVPALLTVLERSRDIDFTQLGHRYLEQTQWRARGRRYYIDKLPINIRMVPFIRRALPHAPILHLVRDPMDVCFSNLKAMLGVSSPYSYDMHALAHYYRLYANLVTHWHQTMPGAMMDISYKALVTSTDSVMKTVLEHCGLDLESACLRPERNASPVATPSSTQVRLPVYTHSLGEWQHYAIQLKPLWQALRD